MSGNPVNASEKGTVYKTTPVGTDGNNCWSTRCPRPTYDRVKEIATCYTKRVNGKVASVGRP